MADDGPAILVVEDDEEVRDLVSATLYGAGFRVETAATGLEAIALIEEKPFDLLIADIKLPGGLDGLEMARHIRSRFPALKCLFMSGKHDPIVCDPELDDFVSKPFRRGELLGVVWKVLRGNQPNPRLEIAR
ncbi:MAG TPA: response regulator [Stellaceae bacterium]|jgi:DNA-binding response OmpR family regulator|nr:response regulator [Stellaceae bacterium]